MSNTQKKDDYVFEPGDFIDMDQLNSGRMSWPLPTRWTSPAEYDLYPLQGHLQEYNGGGYMIDYDLSPGSINNAKNSFLNDILLMRSSGWISEQTRMIAVEITFANYHLHIYTAVTYLVEMAPSGAIITKNEVLPFLIMTDIWNNLAEGLDVFRAVIIVGYIMLVRVYYETKRKLYRGKKGTKYVFSFEGFVDQSICALFIGLQVERIYMGVWFRNSQIPYPHDLSENHHYLYALDGHIFSRFFTVEACLLFMIVLKWCMLMRIVPGIQKYFAAVARATKKFVFYIVIFIPVFAGLVFIANTIWHPYLEVFSRWDTTCLYLIEAISKGLYVKELYPYEHTWTVIFLLYFLFAVVLCFVNGFLAITVHAYFEVELLNDNHEKNQWNKEKLLDWMLYGWVYRALTGEEPGSSFEDDSSEEDDGESDSDEEEDG
jgi:hypothetical protein